MNRNASQLESRHERHFTSLARTLLVTGCIAGLWPADAAQAQDDPLPPVVYLGGYAVNENGYHVLETTIIQLLHEDPNPGGTGLPHKVFMVEPPPQSLGTFFQVEDDGKTIGEPITGFMIEIQNPDSLVGFQPKPFVKQDIAYRWGVENQHGMWSEAFDFIAINPINHPPIAEDRTHNLMEYAQGPVKLLLSYYDPNNDPLTLTIVSVPEQGLLYLASSDPENLITEPGVYPTTKTYYFDMQVEVDKYGPPGCTDFASFQYFVSDHEYDSKIATHIIKRCRPYYPPEMVSQDHVQVIQNQEYTQFELQAISFNDTADGFEILQAPSLGCFPNTNGSWIYCNPIWPVYYGGNMNEDGVFTHTMTYFPEMNEPTEPGDPSMQFEVRAHGGDSSSTNWGPSQIINVTILPYTCNPEYEELSGCCHESCPLCDVATCDCEPLDGSSIFFDGEERYLDLGMFDEFGPAMNSGTIEMWVRANESDAFRPIFSHVEGQSGPDMYHRVFQLRLTSNNELEARITYIEMEDGELVAQGNMLRTYAAGELVNNQWHHLAWRINAELGEMDVLLNAEPLPLTDATTNIVKGSMSSFVHPLRIGIDNGAQGPGPNRFIGHIDEIRFWNVVRHEDLILADMYEKIDPETPGLFGYWRLDEGKGSVAANLADPSGATDAALINQPWWVRAAECDPFEPECAFADLNCDGVVDVFDLIELINNWGPCVDPKGSCPADLNDDGVVDVFDLIELINNWG